MGRFNETAGTYTEADELLAVSCLYAPDTRLRGHDATFAEDLVAALASEDYSGVILDEMRAIGIRQESGTTASFLGFDSGTVPLSGSAGILELQDGSWFVTEVIYLPDCVWMETFLERSRGFNEFWTGAIVETCA